MAWHLSKEGDAQSECCSSCLLDHATKPRAPSQHPKINAELTNYPIAQKMVPARCTGTTSRLMCCLTIAMPNLSVIQVVSRITLPSRGHLASILKSTPNSQTTPSHRKQCRRGALAPHVAAIRQGAMAKFDYCSKEEARQHLDSNGKIFTHHTKLLAPSRHLKLAMQLTNHAITQEMGLAQCLACASRLIDCLTN